MLDIGICAVCKCPVWVPDELYHAAARSDQIKFYCSYGHALCVDTEALKESQQQKQAELEQKQQIATGDNVIPFRR